jgi:hypothetical protein
MPDSLPAKIRHLAERLWRILGGKTPPMQGSFRPYSRMLGSEEAASGRNYDLEIQEYPIRDQDGKARELIELHEWCPEANYATGTIVQDCLSSADGDDQGIIVNELIREGEEVDPEVFVIGMDLIDRVLGYENLSLIIERTIAWGDAFIELGIDAEAMAITELMPLPTWEMFRVAPNGILERFEQRRSWAEKDAISFNPVKIAHFRFQRKNLYGRGLFAASLEDWARLREATEDLALASRQVGLNPLYHRMPPGERNEYLEAYRINHQAQIQDGAIAHYYLMDGEEIGQVGAANPDLKPLIDSVLMWRARIVMASGVPPYLFAGLPITGPRDLSGQPSLAYARRINAIRACITTGIKQIINAELALKGIARERWHYVIAWPRIVVSQFEESAPNIAESGHTDTEATPAQRLERVHAEF